MIINELAQWAAIVFLGFLVFGLTRQLGNYMMGPRDRAILEMGPEVGATVGDDFLAKQHQEQLAELIAERGSGYGVILVVDHGCSTCELIVERIRTEGMPDAAPLVTVSRLDEHADGVGPLGVEIADVAISDPQRIHKTKVGTPFVMIVDGDLTLRHKALAMDVADAVAQWRGVPSVVVRKVPAELDAATQNGVVKKESVGNATVR